MPKAFHTFLNFMNLLIYLLLKLYSIISIKFLSHYNQIHPFPFTELRCLHMYA